jgi:hypothetical protein
MHSMGEERGTRSAVIGKALLPLIFPPRCGGPLLLPALAG